MERKQGSGRYKHLLISTIILAVVVVVAYGALILITIPLTSSASYIPETILPAPTPIEELQQPTAPHPGPSESAGTRATLSLSPTQRPSDSTATDIVDLGPNVVTPAPSLTPEAQGWGLESFGPYLQSVTTHSIVIAWETAEQAVGKILYGETENYASSALEPVRRYRHRLVLEGLKPYTTYHYRVFNDDSPFSDDLTFRTAAPAGQESFRFMVYGDTQQNSAIHRALTLQSLSFNPDFAIHLGDIVQNGFDPQHWMNFFEVEREFLARVPLYTTLGNHEYQSRHYFDLFYLPGNERWYSFTYGEARFICLQIDKNTAFEVGSEQYRWLQTTLEENTEPWLIVFFHIPPYTALDEEIFEPVIRAALTPLFVQHSVDLVLNGHHHHYQRNVADGVTYLISGGGGGHLFQKVVPDDFLVFYSISHHFLLIEVNGDSLTVTAMNAESTPIDTFTISHE